MPSSPSIKTLFTGLYIAALFSFADAPVLSQAAPSLSADEKGAEISYQLPATGPLPQTYRVTLAIVDAKNPNFIISEFASGVVRTVTAKNGGKFTERWDGLDDKAFIRLPLSGRSTANIIPLRPNLSPALRRGCRRPRIGRYRSPSAAIPAAIP
jgi:hypothetical protein